MLQLVTRDGGEDIANARLASRASGRNLAAGVHQTAVPDRGEYGRKGKFMAEHASFQVAVADGYCVARTKQDIAKGATVFLQGKLGFGAAIQIVEYRLGDTTLR